MQPKTFFFYCLSITATVLLAIVLLNFTIDPLLQYRHDPQRLIYLNGSQRLLHPGALKYREYDNLLLGSSMAQYMRPSMVTETLGGRSFNASLAGSSAYEQALTFDAAIKHHQATRILWSLDLFAFSGARLRGAHNLPDYLYDDSHWDDIRYLINTDTTKRSLKTLLGPKSLAPLDPNFDWDWLSARERKYGLPVVRTAVASRRFLHNFNSQHFSAELLQANFTEHFLSRIKSNPQLQFDVFFPPYSMLAWAHLRDIGWLAGALEFKAYMIRELLLLPNVRIHDFQSELAIINNLEQYLDETHFSPEVSRVLLKNIADKNNQVTSPQQLMQNLEALRTATLRADRDKLLSGKFE